ncbi:MAG: DNA gyrase modulator [Eubacteriales bacterium]|nr:DNA gyrase modulator [Eubacteriales bacterium]
MNYNQNEAMNPDVFSARLLRRAKESGVDPAEVSIGMSESFSVRVRAGKLEDYKVSDRLRITLRGRYGARIGTASTQALDDVSIEMLITGV